MELNRLRRDFLDRIYKIFYYSVHPVKKNGNSYTIKIKELRNKRGETYTALFVPYIYSKIEFLFILMVSIVVSIIVFQKILKRKIDETKIVWLQNITYSPLSLGVALVTNNTKEFRRIKGLKVENWTR